MKTVQYTDLSPEAQKTLFGARKIHGFNDAQGEDFETWAQKFVTEFSQLGESALIPHDPFLRMYFTRSAKVCYIDLEPLNDRDHGGLAFTAAAALEAVPDNAPMLALDGDRGHVSAVKVRVGYEDLYVSLHEAEITRSVVIDMPISIEALEQVGIRVPVGATSCHMTPGKIIFAVGDDFEERDLDRNAHVSLKFSHGSYGPLRRAVTA